MKKKKSVIRDLDVQWLFLYFWQDITNITFGFLLSSANVHICKWENIYKCNKSRPNSIYTPMYSFE